LTSVYITCSLIISSFSTLAISKEASVNSCAAFDSSKFNLYILACPIFLPNFNNLNFSSFFIAVNAVLLDKDVCLAISDWEYISCYSMKKSNIFAGATPKYNLPYTPNSSFSTDMIIYYIRRRC
jgi:hypothetical protein